MWQVESEMDKIQKLTMQNIGRHYVQAAARILLQGRVTCRHHLSMEKELCLIVELLSHEAGPLVYAVDGNQYPMVEIVGEGTKDSPYEARWSDKLLTPDI